MKNVKRFPGILLFLAGFLMLGFAQSSDTNSTWWWFLGMTALLLSTICLRKAQEGKPWFKPRANEQEIGPSSSVSPESKLRKKYGIITFVGYFLVVASAFLFKNVPVLNQRYFWLGSILLGIFSAISVVFSVKYARKLFKPDQ